jgi:hypothetical protein
VLLGLLVAVGVVVAAVVVLTKAPVTERRPTAGAVLFSDTFGDERWCDYHRVQNVDYSDDACGYHNDSYALRHDDGAARFEVRPGDSPGRGLGGGERSELSQDSASWQAREGDEWLVHERLRLSEKFKPSRWTILTQFHAGSGPPPLSLQVRQDGALVLRSGGEAREDNVDADRRERVLVRAGEFKDMRGEWFTVDLRVRWSNDVDEGGTEVHIDGELVAPWRAQRTMASSRIYWKAGIYRAPTDSTQVMWLDDLVISVPERRDG